MKLSVKELSDNYDKFLGYIDQYITGERKEQLIKLYTDHQERIMLMPASGTEHYHNCWPGGYVDHVIRVVEAALKFYDLWDSFGATVNYTKEELVFAAINHDLGKIGTEEIEQYIINDSEWHRKNQGKIYKNNPANTFMTVPDRSLKLLADRGIKVTEGEWFGIKLHDGMYDESNKSYYISYNVESRLRYNLPYILHQADQMAARIEYEKWISTKDEPTPQKKKSDKIQFSDSVSDEAKTELLKAFNNLFQ